MAPKGFGGQIPWINPRWLLYDNISVVSRSGQEATYQVHHMTHFQQPCFQLNELAVEVNNLKRCWSSRNNGMIFLARTPH